MSVGILFFPIVCFFVSRALSGFALLLCGGLTPTVDFFLFAGWIHLVVSFSLWCSYGLFSF